MLDMERCDECGEYLDECDTDCKGFRRRLKRVHDEMMADNEVAYQRDVMGPFLGLCAWCSRSDAAPAKRDEYGDITHLLEDGRLEPCVRVKP